MNKIIKLSFIFILSFTIVYSSYVVAEKYPKSTISRPHIFKAKYIPSDANIVRVEIEIYDDTTKDYYDIIEVEFNDETIDLLRANASGERARQYFQLPPGKYLLKWKVSISKNKWPTYETYQKIITLKDTEKYVLISITGDKATVS
jgi:hypothetical protein